MATDAAFRKQTVGRPLRSDAKRCRDGELLAKLRSYGIELDRPSLERLCDGALSAEEIAKSLLDQPASETKRDELESDWIWISIAALWQRWFPDKPSFERLDDKMQAGYDLLASTGAVATFGGRALLAAFRPPFELGEIVRHVYQFGLRSTPLILTAGFAIGIVLSMHTRASLERKPVPCTVIPTSDLRLGVSVMLGCGLSPHVVTPA